MSLLVWLPLINDNHNQGLLNLTPTDYGTVSYINGGKIGKCLSAGNGTDSTKANGLSYNSNLIDELGTKFSCAVWVKPLGNHLHYDGAIISSGNWNAYHWSFGLSQYNSKVSVFGNGHSRYITCAVPTNTWTHLCCTSDEGVTKLYKNGEYIGQTTLSALASDATNFTVGRETYAGGYFSFNGNLNDVRIYNHVLSLKEIKELAKGLVCHYPLNGNGRGGDNLLTNTADLTLWGKESGLTITWDSDKNMYKLQDSTHTSGRWGMYKDITVSANTTYTISCTLQGNAAGVGFACYDSTATWSPNVMSTTSSDGAVRKSYTLTSRANSTVARIYLNTNCGTSTTAWFGLPKVEKGSVATPWIPNPSDTAYTAMGYDSTTEYDVSGYGYNGTKTGTFAYDVDTPRYSVNTNLKSTSTYIKISNLTTTGFANSYSFAWWGKVSSFSGLMMWGFGDGVRLNGIYNGNLWNTGDGAYNTLYVPGTTTQVTVPTTNTWHHFVMTGDGATCKVYQDGELWATAKTYKSISGTTIYINGWDTSTTYKYNNYFVSDFRIYATALSAAQVAELYNTAVSVANNGTLMGYELVEG